MLVVLVPLPCCIIWCPNAFPYKSQVKHVFLGKKVCGRDESRSGCCAFWCVSHYFTQQVDALFTVRPRTHSDLIPGAQKIERPDSGLLQKNGGIIRLKGIFFETFWTNSSGGFEGSETFFGKNHLYLSSFPLSSSLFFFVLSLLLSCSFSILVFSLLFFRSFLLLSRLLFSSLVFSFLFLSCLSFSVSLCLSLCFSLSLSVSVCLCLCVSLSLSPCGVVCCVLCCVVLCVCVVCGAAWHAENASVCRFKTSPCVPAPRAHVLSHAGVVPVHTGRFESTHGDVFHR